MANKIELTLTNGERIKRILPRGVKFNGDYVTVRLFKDGKEIYRKQFGNKYEPGVLDTAIDKVYAIRQQLRDGKFDIGETRARIKLTNACDIFHKLHFEDNPERGANNSRNAKYALEGVKKFFPDKFLDEVNYRDVLKYRAQFENVATANRRTALLASLFNRFEEWIEFGELEETYGIKRLSLPKRNPAKLAETYLKMRKKGALTENSRERVPSKEEMLKACDWCLRHDPDLWNAIEQGIITMQRKQDLIELQNKSKVEGVQGKTGTKFSIPVKFPKPASFVNWRRRWDALRRHMGWLVRDNNSQHMTWHDWRHVGPTLLAELGYGARVIMGMSGHKTESQVERYINPTDSILRPAVESLQKALAAIKTSVLAPTDNITDNMPQKVANGTDENIYKSNSLLG